MRTRERSGGGCTPTASAATPTSDHPPLTLTLTLALTLALTLILTLVLTLALDLTLILTLTLTLTLIRRRLERLQRLAEPEGRRGRVA